MSFQKFIPQKPADAFVDTILYVNIKAEQLYSTPNIFIPNGHPALVIHLANSVRIGCNGKNVLLPNMFFTGLINTYVHLHPIGDLCSIFILFKPNALYHLFKINMKELNQIQFTNIDNVLGTIAYDLYEQLLVTEPIKGKIQLIERFFDIYINRFDHSSDRMCFIIDRIIKEKGCSRVSDLSTHFNIPKRSLYRNFVLQTGLTPKEFARMIRFKNILYYLYTFQKENWSEIIEIVDLTDQSHFINEVKRFTGFAPQKFLALNQDVLRILNGTA